MEKNLKTSKIMEEFKTINKGSPQKKTNITKSDIENKNNLMRKERKQQQFMDNRMKRQNKSNNGKSGDVEMKPPSRESKTIWWNICKNVIKLDEINKPVQFINPNLAFFDHKNSINKLLEDVKKLESYKRTLNS